MNINMHTWAHLFCASSVLFFFSLLFSFHERRLQIYEKEYNSYNIAHTVNISC